MACNSVPTGNALLRAHPELRLAHRSLGEFPTALERLSGLLPAQVELWIKRDDQAGRIYGGNKVRKLEFLLADERLQEGVRVLTSGAYGSHHVLATALYGRSLGLQVEALLYPQPVTPHVRQVLQDDLRAGARLWASRSYAGVPLQLLRALRGRPRLLAPGGSSPLGTVGWVSGGLEIAAQAPAPFDAVYAPLGSGGTVVGLWLGLGSAAGVLEAVRVVPAAASSGLWLRWLALRTRRLLEEEGLRGALPPRPRLRIRTEFLGGGYGHATEATQEAVQRARAVGLELEETYSGKALAALLSDAQAGRLDGKRVLFVHTYSSVALTRGALPAKIPGVRQSFLEEL